MGLPKFLAVLTIFSLAAASFAVADSLNLGSFSFDQVIPPDPTNNIAGLNSFDINAFTGSGALVPDFPVVSEIALADVTLKVSISGQSSPETIALADIDENNPGSFAVSSDVMFTAAELTATIDGSTQPVTVTLANGSTVTVDPTIDVLLSSSNGTLLNPGTDQVVVTAMEVPEPGVRSLVIFGLIGFLALRFVRRGVGEWRFKLRRST